MYCKKYLCKNYFYLLILIGAIACSSSPNPKSEGSQKKIVDQFGVVRVSGNQLVDKNDNPVALRGMSLFWSQWGADFYNATAVKNLKEQWKCTIIRAAMAVESGGYLAYPAVELNKIRTVIDACINEGIYVIIDWHDHQAQDHLQEAKDFFRIIAIEYGDTPNLIYEVYNEPLQVSWSNVIKPYADSVIAEIRSIDPDNLIIVGTPNWSQLVNQAAVNPIIDANVIYTLHFYTGTHFQWLRNEASCAMANGAPLFVSEFGVSEASGDGPINQIETASWFNYMDSNNLSWCNWSFMDKDESSSALLPGANKTGPWDDNEISQSGLMLKNKLVELNTPVFDLLEE